MDTSFELFGKKFSAPVFIAPLGALPLHYGDKYDDITYNRVLINSAANYGICAMTGDGDLPPWFETTMALAPASTAFSAPFTVMMPFMINGLPA